jgi:hypothetical protein
VVVADQAPQLDPQRQGRNGVARKGIEVDGQLEGRIDWAQPAGRRQITVWPARWRRRGGQQREEQDVQHLAHFGGSAAR